MSPLRPQSIDIQTYGVNIAGMDTADFDTKIAQAKAEAVAAETQLAALRGKFMQAVKSWLAQWYQSTVERAVTSQHKFTQQLPAPKLKQLKAATTDLVSRTPAIVDAAFAEVKWPLHEDWPEDVYGNSSAFFDLRNNQEKAIDEVLRWLLGHCARILADAGYITAEDGQWENLQSKLPRYRVGIPKSQDMELLWKQYSEAAHKLYLARERLWNAERRKAEAIAKSVWDQI